MGKKTETPAVEALSYSFLGEVDEESVEKAVKKVTKWALKNPEGDLEFQIHTPGGDLHHGWRLFDTLCHLSEKGHHVTTVVRGEAASFGAVLVQAGDTRAMGANSWLMIHESSGFAAGTVSQRKESATQAEVFNDHMFKVLAKRSKLTVKEIEKNVKHKDWYLDARAAKAAGLVDIVQGEK